MRIHEAKVSSYGSVNTENIVRYIDEYTCDIFSFVKNKESKLLNADRTQLKIIAASLETICKRLDAMEGKY